MWKTYMIKAHKNFTQVSYMNLNYYVLDRIFLGVLNTANVLHVP